MSHFNQKTKTVLLRANPRCHYCGKVLDKDTATLDHFVPKSKGGKDEFSNVVLACEGCNRDKADNLPDKKYINRGFWLL